jgi:hypothetical protein
MKWELFETRAQIKPSSAPSPIIFTGLIESEFSCTLIQKN